MHAPGLSRRQAIGGAVAVTGFLALPQTSLAATPLLQIARAEIQRFGRQAAHLDAVGIVNFSNPSAVPRLHIVDLMNGRVAQLLVAHGRGSDPKRSGWVQSFSNAPGSNSSSEGAYLTSACYAGRHGRSMKLKGLEASNSNAERRLIVVHAAPYVSVRAAKQTGGLGRSQGCFAVAQADLSQVLERLGPGRLIVARKYRA